MAPRSLDYFTWLRRLPPPAQRRHDLLNSGMGAENPERLLAMAGPWSSDAFREFGFHERPPVEEALARLIRLPAEQVLRTSAATGANFTACAALLQPGARVAVERPSYEPLWKIPEFLGAEVSYFQRSLADGALAAGPLPAAELIVVSHPHNPSGHPLAPADLERLLAHARSCGGRLLLAGAYLLFLENDGLPRPLPPELIVTGSLTKTLGLSPLRVGFAAFGDPALRERLLDAYEFTEVYPPSAASELACRLLADDRLLRRGRGHAEALQKLWCNFRARLPESYAFDPPPCGVHALLRLPAESDAWAFAAHAAAQHQVWVTPGPIFQAPSAVRIGCGRPLAEVEAALEALAAAAQPI